MSLYEIPITKLSGIGEKRAALFKKLSDTVGDGCFAVGACNCNDGAVHLENRTALMSRKVPQHDTRQISCVALHQVKQLYDYLS